MSSLAGRRARSRMTLVQDCKGRSHISPSLDNLKVNEPILRPFTIAMAEAGRISKPLKLIKEALVRFYSGEGEEMEETPETAEMKHRRERNINKSAKAILSMLTVIKRKWSKWEGRCALAKSPRQPTASLAESELSASDMDDEALRADLQSLSEELERLLGFSLDPAVYRNLKKAAEKPPVEAAPRKEPEPAPLAAPVEPAPVEPALVEPAPPEPFSSMAPVSEEPPPPTIPEPASLGLLVGSLNEAVQEILSFKPAPVPTKSPKGLAAQLAGMDPAKLKEILAVVNAKLRTVPKDFGSGIPDPARRKLTFDAGSDGELSTSAGSTGSASNPDHVETQPYGLEPETYINEWLTDQRAEHAARVEAAQARERAAVAAEAREKANREAREAERVKSEAILAEAKKDRLKRAAAMMELEETEKPAAMVLTRQQQMGLSAGKKGKLPAKDGGEDEEPAAPEEPPEAGSAKPKAKAKAKAKAATAKTKAKAKAKSKAKAKALPKSRGGKGCEAPERQEDEDEEPAGRDDPPAPSAPKTVKLRRKSTKRRLLCKAKSKKKVKAADDADRWTEYYGDDDMAGNEDEEEAEEEEEPEEAEEEAEPDEAEGEGAEAELLATFARRYCPQRPLFKAKWMGIRDAFVLRVKPFVKTPGKLEDEFWKYVAQATKEDKITNPDAWAQVAKNLTFSFLMDDGISKTWSTYGEELFNGKKRATKKKYEVMTSRRRGPRDCDSQVFILAVLCLVFNERFRLHILSILHGRVRLQILDAALCQQVSKEECLMVVEQEDLEVRQRNYTTEFARHMVDLLPSFNDSPALRVTSMIDTSARDKLRSMDMGADDWSDAGVPELLQYVYGIQVVFPATANALYRFTLVAMALRRDVHSAESLRSGLSFLLRAASSGNVDDLRGVAEELQQALHVAQSEVKTEPGTDSQVTAMQRQLMPELLQKMELLKATVHAQQEQLLKLRDQKKEEAQQPVPQKETQQPAPLKEAQQPAPQKEAQQPAPQKLADPVAEKQAAVVPSSHAEVLKSPGPRGAKRPHVTPEKPKKPSKEPSETDDAEHDEDDEPPKVLNFGTLSKLEKEKVRRICTPKRGSGNLEVPENIFDMWRDCSKGRDNLLRMWAKSGGVKAGGFYSKEDMKTELGYSTSRIEKIVAWAEKKNLHQPRTCEYDDETLEYWVNTRTSGTMTREDLEMMERQQRFEGEGGTDINFKPRLNMDGFDFSDDDDMVHTGTKDLEGDHHKSAPRSTKKMDALVKEFDTLYEEMSEAKAEGGTSGYGEKMAKAASVEAANKSLLSRARKAAKKVALESPMSDKLDIFPWSGSEDEAIQQDSDIDMACSPTSCATTRTREPDSPRCSPGHCGVGLDQRLIPETALASKILWHCVKTVNCIREENGGRSLCVFKLGLTSNPLQRRQSYLEQNFMSFVVIHKVCRLDLLAMLEMLEAALIAEFHDNQRCCRNHQLGGESMRWKDFSPRFPPPYYAYCVPAKDLVQDARAAVKQDPCKVLAKIANIDLSSADAPLYELLQKYELGLPIDFSWQRAGNVNRYPFIKPKAQLEALSAEGYFHRVLGVPVHLASESLALFWAKFRVLHPQHQIFENPDLDYEKLIPYYLHGDGGRGYKKDPIEILTMFPALGSGSRKRSIDLSSKRPAEEAINLGINLTGNSGATRFLFSVVSSLVAKTDGQVFDDLMEIWGQELQSLLEHGFHAQGSTWRVVILGFTGDSPFVKKVAKTTRSFHNVRKRFSSKGLQKGCCWLCHAGYESADGNIHIPFEQLGLKGPAWLQTCRLQNPLPWEDGGGALMQHMLHDTADTPASFFKADFFHVWHAGVGQDFSASGLVYAMKALFSLGSVPKDLDCLNATLKQYLTKSKDKLHCGKLTEDLLGYNSTRDYPEGKWSKNLDTAVIVRFIIYLLELPEYRATVQNDEILRLILSASIAMGHMISTSLRAEYFMSPGHTETVLQSGYAFLMDYSALVSKCYDRALCLFKLRPKIHYLNHILLRIYEEWLSDGFAVNPLAEATFMSEDFVGRAARVSRRVSTRAVAIKTLQRHIFLMKAALDRDSFEMLDLSMLA
ncbi:unnamed protein product [Symbiodinium microadriaticum]|nr:unnamed protein product [Symbiodinium microadriaticum]